MVNISSSTWTEGGFSLLAYTAGDNICECNVTAMNLHCANIEIYCKSKKKKEIWDDAVVFALS